MKTARIVMLAFALFVAFRAGIYFEGQRIIETCNDPNAVTIIQGQRFACLTEDMVRQMQSNESHRGA